MQRNAEPSKSDNLIKPPQVCQRLQISPRNLAYKRASGEIAYCKIGGAIRFLESDIANFIRLSRIGGKKK
jgi:predicted DNA-binding transcriptional regulator AlpA